MGLRLFGLIERLTAFYAINATNDFSRRFKSSMKTGFSNVCRDFMNGIKDNNNKHRVYQ